jgi:hypothetical protein
MIGSVIQVSSLETARAEVPRPIEQTADLIGIPPRRLELDGWSGLQREKEIGQPR